MFVSPKPAEFCFSCSTNIVWMVLKTVAGEGQPDVTIHHTRKHIARFLYTFLQEITIGSLTSISSWGMGLGIQGWLRFLELQSSSKAKMCIYSQLQIAPPLVYFCAVPTVWLPAFYNSHSQADFVQAKEEFEWELSIFTSNLHK